MAKLLKPHDIKVYSSITDKLRYKLCKLKDVRKPQDKKKNVYKIKCNTCNAVYVGETRRTANQRMGEHWRAVEKKDEMSHIYKHYRETRRHSFNFEDDQVLATKKNGIILENF